MKRTKRTVRRRPPGSKAIFGALRLLYADDAGMTPLNTAREREVVWAVLTALRGPDREGRSDAIKHATTGIVRNRVFGSFTTIPGVYCWDSPEYVKIRRRHRDNDTHFWQHARRAFHALDLKWDELNL
jgi:hypothetical protein